MPLTAAIGQAFGPNGRAAGKKAAQQALEGVGRNPLALAWVFAAHDYPLREVVEAVADVLGEAPLLGFSTSGVWPVNHSASRSVVVALLAGEGVEGRADWWSGYISDSAATVQAMVNALQPEQEERSALLVVTDGLGGNVGEMETGLPPGNYKVAGCMAGGNIHVGRT
ncbi:MAG TPA: FIST N-terminal domain-containing protein, partial [Anaerolineales bacterium]|nr:FIST N-terminal domain-containing protein [Anaerolineales bacterium]